VNVHAATLERDPAFPLYLEATAAAFGFDPKRLMIELVEQSAYFDTDRLLDAIRRLRVGVRIAMDDVGLGNCNYRMIVDARPDCLKIDRYFVAGCAADRYRDSVVRSIRQIAGDFGAR
jgi:EAL domain-containing protein (putative c-di-GMP-specific phosphodiesterase class I)